VLDALSTVVVDAGWFPPGNAVGAPWPAPALV
jgi:hypothetical protein